MYISNFCTPQNFRRQTSPLLLACMLSLQSCPTLQPYGLWPARLLCPWDIQARILKWVAISSSRGSSQPRDQTHLTSLALAGRFFTTSATLEAWDKVCESEVAQSCPTLCNPMDYRPPGSSVHGIF